MARYCGEIGFGEQQEVSPGIWSSAVTKKRYYGDIYRNKRTITDNGIHDNIRVNNEISIVCDPYARENFMNILFATVNGQSWKVESVEVTRPRLILTLGGIYNEES